MTQVQKLKILGILGNIRQRLGAHNDDENSYDQQINMMSNDEIIREWSAWKLGDGHWWDSMKSKYDALVAMDNYTEKETQDKESI